MTPHQAKVAIAAILESLADSQLPKSSRIEDPNGQGGKTVWFGSTGWYIGSTKVNGVPARGDYRTYAIEELLQRETVHRTEQALWDARESTARTEDAARRAGIEVAGL